MPTGPEWRYTTEASTPEAFAAHVEREINRWTKVVKEAGLTGD